MDIIVKFIGVLGLVQGLLFCFFILTNQLFNNPVNKHFARFLFLLSIIGLDSLMSVYYRELSPFWLLFFDIIGDDIPWVLLVYLPLFAFFIKATAYSNINFSFPLLCLPFAIFLLINLLIDLDLDFNLLSIPWLTNHRMLFYQLEDVFAFALFLPLHLFIFFVALKKNPNPWLIKLWWYCSSLLLCWFFLAFEHLLFDTPSSYLLLTALMWGSVSCFIYWLIYTGLFQFNLANNRQLIKVQLDHTKESLEVDQPKTKIASSYFDALVALMEKEAVYRNPDLSRELVASQLNISGSYLTQLIKENTATSFTAFVNQYRVRAVERMLLDESFNNFDVLSIGLEAGFRSKSAFFSTFKKYNGASPSQFRKQES